MKEKKGYKIFCYEGEVRNTFKELFYDSDGFDEDGFNCEGFDEDGFNRSSYNRDNFNRHKEIIDEIVKVKESIRKNPWNIYYALNKYNDNINIMKLSVSLKLNTQYNHKKSEDDE